MIKFENLIFFVCACIITLFIFILLSSLTIKQHPIKFKITDEIFLDIYDTPNQIQKKNSNIASSQKNTQEKKIEQPLEKTEKINVINNERSIEEKKINEESKKEIKPEPEYNIENVNLSPKAEDKKQSNNFVISENKNNSSILKNDNDAGDKDFTNNTGVYNQSELDVAPKVLNKVMPEYPYFARESNKTGIVRLSFVILSDGSVSDIKVISETLPGVFTTSAIKALRQWKFQAGILKNKKVSTLATIEFKFKLE